VSSRGNNWWEAGGEWEVCDHIKKLCVVCGVSEFECLSLYAGI